MLDLTKDGQITSQDTLLHVLPYFMHGLFVGLNLILLRGGNYQ